MRRRAAALLVAAGGLAGAGAAAAAGGWSLHRVPAGGFAIATPSSWVAVSDAAQAKALGAAARADPRLASSIQTVEAGGALKLLCLAPGGYPNLSVAEQVTPGI